jgi:hypothetical protein
VGWGVMQGCRLLAVNGGIRCMRMSAACATSLQPHKIVQRDPYEIACGPHLALLAAQMEQVAVLGHQLASKAFTQQEQIMRLKEENLTQVGAAAAALTLLLLHAHQHALKCTAQR